LRLVLSASATSSLARPEAERCHRLGFIFAGKLLDVGTPDEIVERRHLRAAEVEVDDPARIRAASSLAPLASMTGISVSRARSFTLLSPDLAGDPSSSAKSRLAGELLRNRRLRIGSPAYDSAERAR
jgi:ABC-type multidrug transport system ATPase subunit